MMHRSCEVLIVGGGPVGLVLACLLAENGVDVVVLERRMHPRQYSRAIGLHPPALAVLKQLGLEEIAMTQGTCVYSGTAYRAGRRLGNLSFEQAWPDRPYVLTLPQNHTEALLSQRLAEVAPTALHLGYEVTGVQNLLVASDQAGAVPGVQVTARSAAAADAAQIVETNWRADLVVGADGPHSVVRQAAGITTRDRALPDTYVMGDFAVHATEDGHGDADTAAVFLETTGVVESFPLPGRMRRWVAHTGTELAAASPRLLSELIADRTGTVVDPMTSTMISAFQVRRRLAQQMAVGRCVIIGDAAHEVSPIGGQGMTLGWLDALELAPLVQQYFADRNPAPLQRQARFLAFERKQLAIAKAVARQAELNMSLGRPMRSWAAASRDIALKMVLATGGRARLARAFTMRHPLGGAEIQVPS